MEYWSVGVMECCRTPRAKADRAESLRVLSPRLATCAVIPARLRRINSSRNPDKRTGFRVKHGMTFDNPLLAAGQFIEFYPGGSRGNCEGGRE